MLKNIFKGFKKAVKFLYLRCLIIWFRFFGPPRVLNHIEEWNADILRYFGANIGNDFMQLKGPVTLHFGIDRGRFHQALKEGGVQDLLARVCSGPLMKEGKEPHPGHASRRTQRGCSQ